MTRSIFFGTLSIVLFSILIVLIFIVNKIDHQALVEQLKHSNDSLRVSLEQSKKEIREHAIKDSLEARAIFENYFDVYDQANFRLYALYKDTTNIHSNISIARRFNIENPQAIKSSDIQGEKWFIVPVKGIHFVQEEEKLSDISQKYYFNKNDQHLITDFNGKIKKHSLIVIPFN